MLRYNQWTSKDIKLFLCPLRQHQRRSELHTEAQGPQRDRETTLDVYVTFFSLRFNRLSHCNNRLCHVFAACRPRFYDRFDLPVLPSFLPSKQMHHVLVLGQPLQPLKRLLLDPGSIERCIRSDGRIEPKKTRTDLTSRIETEMNLIIQRPCRTVVQIISKKNY